METISLGLHRSTGPRASSPVLVEAAGNTVGAGVALIPRCVFRGKHDF